MTKILATIGPASEDVSSLKSIAKHTNLFRLNGSHNEISWHKSTIKKIRQICPDAFILLDIPGINPRTNNNEKIIINENQEILFGNSNTNKHYLSIELTKPLPKFDNNIKTFSINDGQYFFDVIEHGNDFIVGKSRSQFSLLPKKGVNLPYSIYNENEQFETYLKFIEKIINFDIDGLGLSFVQTGKIVSEIRKIVPQLVLISKIENSEGLNNCSQIISKSDAIMIDRGDLAAEIGLLDLYNSIEIISYETKKFGKPLIMATENVESMINRELPSKSDVMSIVHSISIGSDCIMLSEETATAKNGLEILAWLRNFVSSMKPINNTKFVNPSKKDIYSIWNLVKKIPNMPIVIMTKSGYALFEFMSIKTNTSLILVTTNKKIINISKLFANKINVLYSTVATNTPIETLWKVVNENKTVIFKESKKIAAIFVSKYVTGARANCITFLDKKDFFSSNK